MGLVWRALAALSLLALAANAQMANLAITASNSIGFVYADGAPITLGNNSTNWSQIDKLPINASSRLIAIRANNVLEGCSGILAEMQDNPYAYQFDTNAARWKCHPAAPAGWQNLGFDDSSWHQAYAIVQNGYFHPQCSWIQIHDISTYAYWIWTPNYLDDKDMVVSCRGYTPVCENYSPCQNGGTCLPNSLDFCSCPYGFTGRYCEIYLGPTVGTPGPTTGTTTPHWGTTQQETTHWGTTQEEMNTTATSRLLTTLRPTTTHPPPVDGDNGDGNSGGCGSGSLVVKLEGKDVKFELDLRINNRPQGEHFEEVKREVSGNEAEDKH